MALLLPTKSMAPMDGGRDEAVALADEPTGNLDSHTASVVFGLLIDRVREQQASLILVAHYKGLAEMADRALNYNDIVLC